MSEDLKKELDKILNENTQTNSNDWIMLIMFLALLTPTKQEPPIININLGSDKNVQ
jgi:hypothetical protein